MSDLNKYKKKYGIEDVNKVIGYLKMENTSSGNKLSYIEISILTRMSYKVVRRIIKIYTEDKDFPKSRE